MKISVTGARNGHGLLGQAILVAAAAAGHEVCVLASDITDPLAFAQELPADTDVVIHCASLSRVDECEGNPGEALRVNALGTRNVAAACQAINAAMVHISTDYVFDGTKATPYLEYDTPCPINAYGRSKAEAERLAQACCTKLFIVRISWLFGHNGPNFVSTIIKAARSGEPLRVVDDQWGSPSFAPDIAQALVMLAATQAYGIYHFTNSDSTNWYAFTRLILDRLGLHNNLLAQSSDHLTRPARRPANSRLANTYGPLEGIPPLRSYQDALAQFLQEIDH